MELKNEDDTFKDSKEKKKGEKKKKKRQQGKQNFSFISTS